MQVSRCNGRRNVDETVQAVETVSTRHGRDVAATMNNE